MPKTYFIGWVSQAVRTAFLSPPEAPSNYKDEAKIRQYKEDALAKMMAEAASVAVVGSLVSVHIEELGAPGVPAFQHASPTAGVVSKALFDWLKADDTEIALMYGFDADILLEIAGMEVLMGNRTQQTPYELPFRLWKETSYIQDPYKKLLRTETRKFISLPQLVKALLGQDFTPQAFTDPREQIRLARAIVTQSQMPGT